MAKPAQTLNPKQRRFAAEYLIDLNATQAAIRAGYSAKTADRAGPRLVTHPGVCALIEAGKAKQLQRLDISATRVLAELSRLGFSDLRLMFDPETGKLKDIRDLTDEAAAALASVEVTRETTRRGDESDSTEQVIKVKAWDKLRALEMLAKHLGILKDRVSLENPDGSAVTFTINIGDRG
jgi:phage terminase small subunit